MSLVIYFLTLFYLPSSSEWAMAALLVAFTAAAYRFPIHFDVKSSTILDSSIIFASALLFQPGLAMLIIVIGALIGHISRSFEPEEMIFNLSQAALQAAFASLVLLAVGWNFGSMDFDGGRTLAVLLIVASTIYLTNTVLVALVIALHTGMNPFRVWLQSTTRNDGIEQVGQFTLGALAAIVASAQPWALPLLLVPGIIIGLSLRRQNELRERTINAVQRLADLVDLRDPYTASHSRRVAGIAREIATALGLDPDDIRIIERAGQVHDIGKIVIDLGLLSKPDKLTNEEWKVFQQHPVSGVQMLELFPDFADGVALVRSHHERVDGNGYPDGIAGDEIPLGARILAVADAFDAMASPRPYRGALPPEVVLSELTSGRGTHWDARVVDALLQLIDIGRVVIGDANQRPYIVDAIGYEENLEFEAA